MSEQMAEAAAQVGRTTVRVETRCFRAREHVAARPASRWVQCPECFSVIVTEVSVPFRAATRWPPIEAIAATAATEEQP